MFIDMVMNIVALVVPKVPAHKLQGLSSVPDTTLLCNLKLIMVITPLPFESVLRQLNPLLIFTTHVFKN
jgi:hypothetical protein